MYPSLGIGAAPSTRYPRAWPIPTARISPATLTAPSCTPSFGSTSSPSSAKPPIEATHTACPASSSRSSATSSAAGSWLEQLCRYLFRPPLAQDRVRLRAAGRVLVELKKVWRDGTSHFLFEPVEFLEKLAALIPRPAVNLVLYHGLLAPRVRWRSQVVRYGRPAPDPKTHEVDPSAGTPSAWSWAALMRRVFDLDVLACPRCGGRLRVIATVHDPLAVQAVLAHPAARPAAPRPRPSRSRRLTAASSTLPLTLAPRLSGPRSPSALHPAAAP